MIKKTISVFIILAFFSIHHSELANALTERSPRSTVKGLTQEDAETRSEQLDQIHSTIAFSISAEEKEFTGKETLSFHLKRLDLPLTLDFQDGSIVSLAVNDQKLTPNYNGSFITIEPGNLALGENRIEIEFSHRYSAEGTGLHRFKDPEDGRMYLYSFLFPFEANRFYPCFDQPDLKSTFTLTVEAPSDWTVISTARESSVLSLKGQRKLWSFPETARISTYLLSLHAGHYQSWESTAGKIPIRLFSRRSIAKYIDHKAWLETTRNGLAHYQSYFDFPYPFYKYDQIVVPEFNYGAMENAAAVSFSERYIVRGKAAPEDLQPLVDTILHEMAHMWFGDLVTMKWWNGLWLNESFATIMSVMTTESHTEFKSAPEEFYSLMKQWGYIDDQQITTHPVEVLSRDTEQAVTQSDGITYGKGASVLKQLFFYLGEDASREGLRTYFKKHQYGNVTLADFIGALEEASHQDLQEWKTQWLETPGLNTVSPSYECRDGKVRNFSLLQTAPPENPQLRAHRTEVAFFAKSADGQYQLFKSAKATYSGEKTALHELNGLDCPAIVFPNYHDRDYVKWKMDTTTRKNILRGIAPLPETFLRMMAWLTLWDLVRDGELEVQAYGELVIRELAQEKSLKIVDRVLATVVGRQGEVPYNMPRIGDASVIHYLPKSEGKAQDYSADYLGRLETFLWKNIGEAKMDSNFQKRWLDAYTKMARSPVAQSHFTALLENRHKNIPLDQDRRWNIIRQLNRIDATRYGTYLTAEQTQDHSNSGVTMALAAKAIQPDLTVKKNQWKKILSREKDLSFARARAVMSNLLPYDQMDLRKSMLDDYFKELNWVNQAKEPPFQRAYVENLSLALCNELSVKRFTDAIDAGTGLSPVLVQGLKVSRQEDSRCIVNRALAERKLREATVANLIVKPDSPLD